MHPLVQRMRTRRRRRHGGIDLLEHRDAARPQCGPKCPHGRDPVRLVHQDSATGDCVERPQVDGRCEQITDDELDVACRPLGRRRAGPCHCTLAAIDPNDRAALTHDLRELEAQLAGRAADVEHPHPGCNAGVAQESLGHLRRKFVRHQPRGVGIPQPSTLP